MTLFPIQMKLICVLVTKRCFSNASLVYFSLTVSTVAKQSCLKIENLLNKLTKF